MHLEPDAVAEAWKKPLSSTSPGFFVQLRRMPVLVEEVAAAISISVRPLTPGFAAAIDAVERLLAEAVELAQLVRIGSPTTYVRVMSV